MKSSTVQPRLHRHYQSPCDLTPLSPLLCVQIRQLTAESAGGDRELRDRLTELESRLQQADSETDQLREKLRQGKEKLRNYHGYVKEREQHYDAEFRRLEAEYRVAVGKMKEKVMLAREARRPRCVAGTQTEVSGEELLRVLNDMSGFQRTVGQLRLGAESGGPAEWSDEAGSDTGRHPPLEGRSSSPAAGAGVDACAGARAVHIPVTHPGPPAAGAGRAGAGTSSRPRRRRLVRLGPAVVARSAGQRHRRRSDGPRCLLPCWPPLITRWPRWSESGAISTTYSRGSRRWAAAAAGAGPRGSAEEVLARLARLPLTPPSPRW